MKIIFKFTLLVSLLFNVSCSKPIPQKEDYSGVYRIIKIVENSEKIKTPTLNQIELTDDFYISRIDRNGDNKFSEDEISKSTYIFGIDVNNEPYITITGNSSKVMLLPDNYYDLLFQRIDENGRVTTIFMNKVR